MNSTTKRARTYNFITQKCNPSEKYFPSIFPLSKKRFNFKSKGIPSRDPRSAHSHKKGGQDSKRGASACLFILFSQAVKSEPLTFLRPPSSSWSSNVFPSPSLSLFPSLAPRRLLAYLIRSTDEGTRRWRVERERPPGQAQARARALTHTRPGRRSEEGRGQPQKT